MCASQNRVVLIDIHNVLTLIIIFGLHIYVKAKAKVGKVRPNTAVYG